MDRSEGEVIMKMYNAIIITDKDKIDILYECDNKKNIRCKGRNNCRDCEYTSELRYGKDISKDKTRLELKKELIEKKKELIEKDKEIEEYKQILRKIIEGQDIHNIVTLNQKRKIYNLKPIN